MKKARFRQMNCGIAQALEVLGDRWTLLIIREGFLGTRRFADFQANLGIAKNILSRRLRHLVRRGIFEKVDAGVRGQRYEYQLTDRGMDLLTVVTALRQWGDRWVYGEGEEPIIVRDRKSGRRVPRLHIRDAEGAPLSLQDLVIEPGPGANEETRQRFSRASAGPFSTRPAESENQSGSGPVESETGSAQEAKLGSA